jgi:hypothetical protein
MIKADDTTVHIPVILVVGSFEQFDPGEASRVGSNYYFTKPFSSIRELVSKVKEYLELGAFDAQGPELTDIDDLYDQSVQIATEKRVDQDVVETLEKFELPETAANEQLGDAGADDELIEAESFGGDGPGHSTLIDDVQAEPATIGEPSPVLDLRLEKPAEDGLDETASSIANEQLARVLDAEEAENLAGEVTGLAISPEQIDQIVQLVIAKMSNKAVKEIARKEVPKIAEKLIREALDAENKEK